MDGKNGPAYPSKGEQLGVPEKRVGIVGMLEDLMPSAKAVQLSQSGQTFSLRNSYKKGYSDEKTVQPESAGPPVKH